MAIKLPTKPSNKAKTLAKIGESSWGEHQIPTPFIDRLTVVYHPQDDVEAEVLPALDHPAGEFSGSSTHGGPDAPEAFMSDIGGLLPMAL